MQTLCLFQTCVCGATGTEFTTDMEASNAVHAFAAVENPERSSLEDSNVHTAVIVTGKSVR